MIGRDHLGFGGEKAPDQPGLGSKERDRGVKSLQQACQVWIRELLEPEFGRRCANLLKGERGWKLHVDAEDSRGQTLLLAYPSVFEAERYLRPVVRIELGARSDTEPVQQPVIRPYVDQVRPESETETAFAVRTVAPERTFWEKAMLLHEETYRVGATGPRDRLARHYYDLWCLIRAGVGARAMENQELRGLSGSCPERICVRRGSGTTRRCANPCCSARCPSSAK